MIILLICSTSDQFTHQSLDNASLKSTNNRRILNYRSITSLETCVHREGKLTGYAKARFTDMATSLKYTDQQNKEALKHTENLGNYVWGFPSINIYVPTAETQLTEMLCLAASLLHLRNTDPLQDKGAED